MGTLCSICQESNPAFAATAASSESSYEKTISAHEKQLSLSKVSSVNIRKSISAESANGALNFKALQRTSNQLGFDAKELQNPDSSLSHFFSEFIDQNEDYNSRLISTAGVLISNSSVKDKADVLCEMYDLNQNSLLKQSELRKMAEEAFHVSVDCLPKLSLNSQVRVSDDIEEYLKQIRGHKEMFVTDLVGGLLKGQPEVGKQRFVELVITEYQYLVSSSGIRTWVFINYTKKTNS